MRGTLVWMAVLTGTSALGGCASAGNFSADGGPKVYGGTRVDVALISGDLGPDADPADVKKVKGTALAGAACCGLVDLPFSFVADTLLLPVTAPMAMARARAESQSAERAPTDEKAVAKRGASAE